jgi:two-component system sensor histidine kinase LytS
VAERTKRLDLDELLSGRWRAAADLVLLGSTLAIGAAALLGQRFGLTWWAESAAIVALTLLALSSGWARMVTRPDHLRAQQSQTILDIANQSIGHLRKGLAPETAQAVCRLVLSETDASAVAMTDTTTVLGFAGVAEDHHTVGGPIITRATLQVLATGEHEVLESSDEIGCPRDECPLVAAIVVPLTVRDVPVGTLKFYYTSPRLLNETQVALAEGLGTLLSTQLELSELDRQTELATRMELRALQAQINPHFLFNTLNTIAHFIRTDPTEARRLLREFASFYRITLEHDEDLITVAQEIEFTRTYLDLEQARFGDRLLVDVGVAEDAKAVRIPAFVIQPLVENAIQHGFPAGRPLEIRLTSEGSRGCLMLLVSDNGVGIEPLELPKVLEPGYGRGLGIALKNIHDRLTGHFGPRSGLTISSEVGTGTTVRLTIDLEYARVTEAGDTDDAAKSAGL